MPAPNRILSSLLICWIVLTADHASGDEPDTHKLLRRAYQNQAQQLSISFADALSTPLKLVDDPVMTWTSIGGWSGDIFAWTGKGRIQVIGCIGSRTWEEGKYGVFLELHSLAAQPLNDVQLDENHVWRVPVNTFPRLEIQNAPPPEVNPERRMIQMRRLAKLFQVGMQVDNDNVEGELRLLTQPLIRETASAAPDQENGVVDSVIFAYVSSAGTDPELFLLLEATGNQDKLRWTYSPLRFTTREIWLSVQGEEVWRGKPTDNSVSKRLIEAAYFYHAGPDLSLDQLRSQ